MIIHNFPIQLCYKNQPHYTTLHVDQLCYILISTGFTGVPNISGNQKLKNVSVIVVGI